MSRSKEIFLKGKAENDCDGLCLKCVWGILIIKTQIRIHDKMTRTGETGKLKGKEIEVTTEYGLIRYAVRDSDVVLTEYRGRDLRLVIPETVMEKPVTVIGKKAFLGAKGLRELALPRQLGEIQEWAFASCSNLEILSIPAKKLIAGQGILKDCFHLQQIVPCFAESDIGADIPFLLAAAMNMLEAFYLFDPQTAGSTGWLEQWDARMRSLLEQGDAEGFSKMLLCGEEDYGSRENNIDYYMEQKRRFKVRLSMLRLMHDAGLAPSVREELTAYLTAHTKGKDTEETWKVVLEEHGDDRQYYAFLLDHDCINSENFDDVLADLGDRHTEMKAFLMNSRRMEKGCEDAFAGLAFDL